MRGVENDFKEALNVLNVFVSDSKNMKAIEKAASIMIHSLKNGNKIISCGNGGSLCDAMHFAEELTGRFRKNRQPLAAIAISDPAHITCVANDFGYEYIFSRYVEAIGKSGDVLLAISTSGNSENVRNAVIVAKEKRMPVVALTGKSGGRTAQLCDVEIRTPYSEYSDRVQEIHIIVIHAMVNTIEMGLSPEDITPIITD